MERHHLFEAALVLALISLVGLLYLAIVSTPPASYSWEAQANGTIDYMFVGGDDKLYAFSGNTITAVGKDGGRLWNLTIPAEWKVLNDWWIPVYGMKSMNWYTLFTNYPIVSESDGHLYVFALRDLSMVDTDKSWDSNGTRLYSRPSNILAISQDGTIEWEHTLPGNVSADTLQNGSEKGAVVPAINAEGARIYVFHNYAEDVLDLNGNHIFTLDNVSSPVAVDETGHIYAVRGITHPLDWPSFADNAVLTGETGAGGLPEYDRIFPSGIVDAYDPDGRLEWSTDLGINTTKLYVEQDLWPSYNSIPIYVNSTLYVPVQRGYAALDTGGKLKWIRQVENGPQNPEGLGGVSTYIPLSIMPVDCYGNAYLARMDWDNAADAIYIITPDGNASIPGGNNGAYPQYFASDLESLAGEDGIIYALESIVPLTDQAFNESIVTKHLDFAGIVSYNVKQAAVLWNFTPPANDTQILTLNASNYASVLQWAPWGILPDNENAYLRGYFALTDQRNVDVYPGKDVIYVNYYHVVYESPLTLDHSRCIYINSIFALDKNGKLLWEKPVDGFVTKAAVGNGAIYYLTSNGKMGGGTAGVAAGIALVAAAYVFLRFFMVGAVARARNRIDQNDNRNRAFRYIVDNPGATAVDLSRGLGMNIGTIRYHLFVLSINHKIVYHKEDGKYLRCFTNSGTYTPEERVVLSLLRRKSLSRMLGVLAECPCLTSLELSRRMGVSTTVAHRHINELMERGVIVKVCGTDKGNVYSINERHRDLILRYLA